MIEIEREKESDRWVVIVGSGRVIRREFASLGEANKYIELVKEIDKLMSKTGLQRVEIGE